MSDLGTSTKLEHLEREVQRLRSAQAVNAAMGLSGLGLGGVTGLDYGSVGSGGGLANGVLSGPGAALNPSLLKEADLRAAFGMQVSEGTTGSPPTSPGHLAGSGCWLATEVATQLPRWLGRRTPVGVVALFMARQAKAGGASTALKDRRSSTRQQWGRRPVFLLCFADWLNDLHIELPA